jgi:hypothetical protein
MMRTYPFDTKVQKFREDADYYDPWLPSRFDFIPGITVPVSCLFKVGGEEKVRDIVQELVADHATRLKRWKRWPRLFNEPSPIVLARSIAIAVTGAPESEYRERVRLSALQTAWGYGDWCGGEIDPMEVGNSCLRWTEERIPTIP